MANLMAQKLYFHQSQLAWGLWSAFESIWTPGSTRTSQILHNFTKLFRVAGPFETLITILTWEPEFMTIKSDCGQHSQFLWCLLFLWSGWKWIFLALLSLFLWAFGPYFQFSFFTQPVIYFVQKLWRIFFFFNFTSDTGSMKVRFLFFFSASAWAVGQEGRNGWRKKLFPHKAELLGGQWGLSGFKGQNRCIAYAICPYLAKYGYLGVWSYLMLSYFMFSHLGHVDDTVWEGGVGEKKWDHGGGRCKCSRWPRTWLRCCRAGGAFMNQSENSNG